MSEDRVTVGLGSRAYDIVIGEDALDRAGALIRPLMKRPRTVIVTDENVRAAQGPRLEASLKSAFVRSISLSSSSTGKSMRRIGVIRSFTP